MGNKSNDHIGCSVESCKYHCKEDYTCSLNRIAVGACNCNPCHSDATCCKSFEVDKKSFEG